MLQIVYDTNLDLALTEDRISRSEAIKCFDYHEKDILWLRLKDDDEIKEIQITPKGKVMIFGKSLEAVNKRLPLIKSLTLSQAGKEADWKLSKIVKAPADRLRDIKDRLQKIKPTRGITGYNAIITPDGRTVELEVPELDYFYGRGKELSEEERKILQIEGNRVLSEKLLHATEEKLDKKERKREGQSN